MGKKRNTELLPALLLAGSYDPSSIWFQYFLCKDIDLYCYFFTQGWTQGQYGQYYLYDNLLDDNTGLFAGATDTNLGTIALLGGLGGGLGGGYGQHGGYYPAPAYGAHPAPAQGGRKRRGGDEEEEEGETTDGRKRRSGTSVDCSKNSDDPACNERKRRDTCDGNVECEENRKRREAEIEACAICRLNNDSMMCEECDE